jgi:magnesium chelatase subunit I
MSEPRTLGELRASRPAQRVSVKEEMRRNLLRKLEAREPIFPGIVGYDESVVPQLVNAVLSRHNMILLGLRGQAKSRILRSLTSLLDAVTPMIAGCEINDDPFRPLCKRCRDLFAEKGDATPVAWLGASQRYVEKLATPDVTIADIIGDVDPIRAARGGFDLASELTMHYGLLPRAHRGIFALNELPDLAGRIQVGLFNILQEGKIITPLKDRIGSEIRTHYPTTIEHGVAITAQEAWTDREANLVVPRWVREVVEGVAFAARRDKKIDRRSGVSQRLPISALENAVSNAERRALLAGESPIVPRISDIYASLPSLTGKFELEYEGELLGAEVVARELIREAVGEVFSTYLGSANFRQVVRFFEEGGTLRIREGSSSEEVLGQLQRVPEVLEHLEALGAAPEDPAPLLAAAGEFVLEGLWAQKKIGRSDDRGFVAPERRADVELDLERLERLRKLKKQVN